MKKKNKKNKTGEKGEMSFVVLFLIAVVSVLLVGGGAVIDSQYNIFGRLAGYNPFSTHTTQQLTNLKFITFTPSPILSPTSIPGTSSVPTITLSPTTVPTVKPVTNNTTGTGSLADCGYTNIPSDETGDILYSSSPGSAGSVGLGGKIELWYNDEHALTLGAGSNVSPNSSSPQYLLNPNTGDQTAKDKYGFYWRPGLYLTDVTGGSSTAGDAEKGGIPSNPSEIYGTWKTALGGDPAKNSYNLGSGADPFPPTGHHGSGADDIYYGSLIIWNVNSLLVGSQPLQTGHTYRAEFILHDGDSDKGSSDIGIGCATISL